MSKIKLVVYNEHTLGYVIPPGNNIGVLHSSPLKGSPTTSTLTSSFPIRSNDTVRLAGRKDFDEYRVSFQGFDNPKEYIYDEEQDK
jgi:hypothetical protein